MKSLLLLCCVFFLGSAAKAQQYQFIYLQTESKQPFYVRLNDKLYSSSAAGYLVIPKLKEGSHALSIGFPKNEWPAQNIEVKVGNKDLGFILKYFDNNWGLFNFQTMELVTAANGQGAKSASETTTKTDQFSNILADVVNTPSIKQEKKEVVKTVVVPDPPKAVPAQPVIENKADVAKPIESIAAQLAMPSDIQKLSSVSGQNGLMMVYVDKFQESPDTINIWIESPKNLNSETLNEKQAVKAAKIETEKTPEASPATTGQSSPKFMDMSLPNPNEQTKVGEAEKLAEPSSLKDNQSSTSKAALKPLMINSDCKQLATEADFLKIRKKMTSENNDDDMVKAATKLFKQKCYSTDQVKNLSVLFLNDEGKYKFFDAAYPYIHDTQSFKQLESQLIDPYIVTRFRAMIRN